MNRETLRAQRHLKAAILVTFLLSRQRRLDDAAALPALIALLANIPLTEGLPEHCDGIAGYCEYSDSMWVRLTRRAFSKFLGAIQTKKEFERCDLRQILGPNGLLLRRAQEDRDGQLARWADESLRLKSCLDDFRLVLGAISDGDQLVRVESNYERVSTPAAATRAPSEDVREIPYPGHLTIGRELIENEEIIWIGFRRERLPERLTPAQRAVRLRQPDGLVRDFPYPLVPSKKWWPYETTDEFRRALTTGRHFDRTAGSFISSLASRVFLSLQCRSDVESPEWMGVSPNEVPTFVGFGLQAGDGDDQAARLALQKYLQTEDMKAFLRARCTRQLVVVSNLSNNLLQDLIFDALPMAIPHGLSVFAFGEECFAAYLQQLPEVWSQYLGEGQGFRIIPPWAPWDLFAWLVRADPELWTMLDSERAVPHPAIRGLEFQAQGTPRLLIVGRDGSGRGTAAFYLITRQLPGQWTILLDPVMTDSQWERLVLILQTSLPKEIAISFVIDGLEQSISNKRNASLTRLRSLLTQPSRTFPDERMSMLAIVHSRDYRSTAAVFGGVMKELHFSPPIRLDFPDDTWLAQVCKETAQLFNRALTNDAVEQLVGQQVLRDYSPRAIYEFFKGTEDWTSKRVLTLRWLESDPRVRDWAEAFGRLTNQERSILQTLTTLRFCDVSACAHEELQALVQYYSEQPQTNETFRVALEGLLQDGWIASDGELLWSDGVVLNGPLMGVVNNEFLVSPKTISFVRCLSQSLAEGELKKRILTGAGYLLLATIHRTLAIRFERQEHKRKSRVQRDAQIMYAYLKADQLSEGYVVVQDAADEVQLFGPSMDAVELALKRCATQKGLANRSACDFVEYLVEKKLIFPEAAVEFVCRHAEIGGIQHTLEILRRWAQDEHVHSRVKLAANKALENANLG